MLVFDDRKLKPQDEASEIDYSSPKDHPFEPRGAWYTLCKHCSLAEAAHDETTVNPRDHIGYSDYDDD